MRPLSLSPRRPLLVAVALIALPAAAFLVGRASAQDAKPDRLFELRVYTAHEGKLAELNTRFRDHTNRLFQKHGMDLVGYWTPAEGERAADTLIYVLAFPDAEARNKAWTGFRDDPEWITARDESQVNGPLVKGVESTPMTPTDYSPIR